MRMLFVIFLVIAIFGQQTFAMDSFSVKHTARLLRLINDGMQTLRVPSYMDQFVIPGMKAALKKNADPNASVNGITALHFAAMSGYKEIAEIAVQKGAIVDTQDLNGYTALMHAAEYGFDAVFGFLLTKGADAQWKAPDGQTVRSLGHARRGPWQQIPNPDRQFARVVDKIGSDQIKKSKKWMAKTDIIVDSVLKSGATMDLNPLNDELNRLAHDQKKLQKVINAKSYTGKTALMEALCHQNIPAALLLIRFGARPKSRISIMQSDEARLVKEHGNKELTNRILPIFREMAYQRLCKTLRSLSKVHDPLKDLPEEIRSSVARMIEALEFDLDYDDKAHEKPSLRQKFRFGCTMKRGGH